MRAIDRQSFSTLDSVAHVWRTLELPSDALRSLKLVEDANFFSSSFKVGHLAHASIVLSALAAALLWSTKASKPVPVVSVSSEHACAEFISERLYTLDGIRLPSPFGKLGGLHKTADGYVRMHDGFPHHLNNALKLLGLYPYQLHPTREEVANKMRVFEAVELETAAFEHEAVIVALRSFQEWDILPQAKAVADFPIRLQKIRETSSPVPLPSGADANKYCLRGVRIVELSRIIAAPVAGRTLAAHGADVIWVTSPTLPNQPELDIDMARGKRTVQLNIKKPQDRAQLLELIRTADVFLSSYRPGSLAAQGFSSEELVEINPNLVIATLNAWGEDGPWAKNRGFDSLVQAASGLNVAEAEHFDLEEPSKVLPCQALDHGSGYFLATGIMAALYKRTISGGAYEVHVSLAGVMKYLRSLGQLPKESLEDRGSPGSEVTEKYMETRATTLGVLKAITHSASISGVHVGYEDMPKPLGSDDPTWPPSNAN
ncbi:CoA-transferase family III [Paraphaeosphaeria sporulosa]|uniref:CoA-transferase family III n=1 Tax=Paraphaeosphaeria sporulosa TaxID=1460663 RepID=A0A177CCA0_9PLEO|nr:CoA-transferase family III [Paraphaeosphaeria sporulosa]OAG04502.1 CoA-transferase family III [Paraphaeosphaeria sporulosa]